MRTLTPPSFFFGLFLSSYFSIFLLYIYLCVSQVCFWHCFQRQTSKRGIAFLAVFFSFFYRSYSLYSLLLLCFFIISFIIFVFRVMGWIKGMQYGYGLEAWWGGIVYTLRFDVLLYTHDYCLYVFGGRKREGGKGRKVLAYGCHGMVWEVFFGPTRNSSWILTSGYCVDALMHRLICMDGDPGLTCI